MRIQGEYPLTSTQRTLIDDVGPQVTEAYTSPHPCADAKSTCSLHGMLSNTALDEQDEILWQYYWNEDSGNVESGDSRHRNDF
mmetsp:Transcript_15126/g.22750  ORF Transcript_15126/g.22750 Transcript_15126/m.22750 type:complete len:83 (-) Transcript_15126:83-331(-)